MTGKRGQLGYRFTVRDYGGGIPEGELGKVTEAFYKVDKSRSGQHKGAGLGLTLCAEILALHQSRLEIESTVGEGTSIGFSLSWEGESS